MIAPLQISSKTSMKSSISHTQSEGDHLKTLRCVGVYLYTLRMYRITSSFSHFAFSIINLKLFYEQSVSDDNSPCNLDC